MGSKLQAGKKYIFLDSDVYSPVHLKVVFGSEVFITKVDGDEIWFDFFGSQNKGYVVYPSLFVEPTTHNRKMVNSFKKAIRESEQLHKAAFKFLENLIR